ncbi:MAG: YdeI/OmpD-associated family protein [Dehalococcoidia bacterium]|nr:MAG: YdeI/OmpD-associated family protein [Dehalococcoidia bacterium]
MEQDKVHYFKDRYQWYQWLLKNHNTTHEIWLLHYKKSSNRVGMTYDEAVEEAICFGWIDGKLKSIDNETFLLRYSPRKARSVWSMLNKERAEKLIKMGKMTSAGLLKIEEAKRNGYWNKAYTNKKKDKLPDDLKQALLKDSKTWSNFSNFANSYRNTYIGWVESAKTEETRKRRIAEVVRRSLINKKPGIV